MKDHICFSLIIITILVDDYHKLILKWSLDGIAEVQKEKAVQSIICMTFGFQISGNRELAVVFPL